MIKPGRYWIRVTDTSGKKYDLSYDENLVLLVNKENQAILIDVDTECGYAVDLRERNAMERLINGYLRVCKPDIYPGRLHVASVKLEEAP